MENIKDFARKYKLDIVIFVVIFAIAIFLRTYKLDEIPAGINVDEAGMAYDAFCLSKFKVDRALNHLPVYFVNFGCGQSVLYGYITSVFIKIFGYSLSTIRITAVLFNCIAILLFYIMARKELGKKSGLILAILLTINPWNIMSSRWGLDCNLLAPALIISIFFLMRAKKWYDYIIAGISFSITLYTYAISYLIIPLFLFIVLLYMLYTKKIEFKNVIIFGIPIFILAIPLILMLLVNSNIIDQINWKITIPKFPDYRSSEISFSNILSNLQSLYRIFVFDGFTFDAIPKFGTLYNFAIVLSVMGIFIESYKFIINIKNKKFKFNSVIFILFLAVASIMLLVFKISIYKSNAIYFPLIFFCFVTIQFLFEKQKLSFKENILKNKETSKEYRLNIKWLIYEIILIIIIVLYVINFVDFIKYYFTEYAKVSACQAYFERDLIEAIRQVNGRAELQNKRVCILSTGERPYIYTLYANPISPYDFNKTRGENDSYGRFIINKEEIDPSYAYIIRGDFDFSYKLVSEYGFTSEKVGIYTILFKPEN